MDITLPLLADPDVEMIDAFGIVNTNVPKDSAWYGFAYAGWYLVGPDGVVKSKYFNEANNDRVMSSNILLREFGDLPKDVEGQVKTDHATITWRTSNKLLRPGERIALTLTVELQPGLTVYAPGVEGYIPVAWSLDEPPETVQVYDAEFPEAREKHLPAIKETARIYENTFTIVRELRINGGRELPEALADLEKLELTGTFTYQACNDTVCFFPIDVPLKWTIDLKGHDRVRAPENLQRGDD